MLPRYKLLYVATCKAALTRIWKTLARVEGRFSRSLRPSKRSSYHGPYGRRNMTIGSFHQLATDPATLRFSLVRNSYARNVSRWADKNSRPSRSSGKTIVLTCTWRPDKRSTPVCLMVSTALCRSLTSFPLWLAWQTTTKKPYPAAIRYSEHSRNRIEFHWQSGSVRCLFHPLFRAHEGLR